MKKIITFLKSIEWSGWARGPGSGYMGSGEDGVESRACIKCGGIDPKDPYKGNFAESAHGHQKGCKFVKMMKTLDSKVK